MSPTAKADADVVVVGAGLAGLAAAHRLTRMGHTVVVLEESQEVGGRARSVVVDGAVIDLGAQFISDFYHDTLALIGQLGLTDDLAPRSQKALITRAMKPEFIWPPKDLLASDGLSLAAKVRLVRLLPELAARWRHLDVTNLLRGERFDTESAAANLERICGTEDLDYFFAPILRALLYWEADTTSMLVVLAILKAFVSSKNTYYMQRGMGAISEALAAGLDVRRGMRAHCLRVDGGLVSVQAAGELGDTEVQARGAVCATPATVSARIVSGLEPAAVEFLDSVTYTRTALLTYSLPAAAESYPEGAVLFPVKLVDDIASINPVYSAHPPGPGRAGTRLLDIFLSSEGFEKYCHLPDDQLAETVLARVKKLVGESQWVSSAKIVHVQRWPEALPRFRVGHVRKVHDFRTAQCGKTVGFAGDYLDGPYIDGALRSGLTAAEAVSGAISR